jgi:DNA/RNA endonuclease G (NUC1)
MKKILIFILFSIIPLSIISQKLRARVLIKSDIFEMIYSEVLEQPLYVKYRVLCPNGSTSRDGMKFYTNDSIHTSDDDDYIHNVYDRGHLAPAASFSCNKVLMYKTFTYLNSSLQHQDLNRTTWKFLEIRERELAKKYGVVVVEVYCQFTKKSIKLNSGATVPDGFIKKIKYKDRVEKYYFKNEKPLYLEYSRYLLK